MSQALDHGYFKVIETWGSDERIIESARMSTNKGFQGWGNICIVCNQSPKLSPKGCRGPSLSWTLDISEGGVDHQVKPVGDEKLLKYLWDNKHSTPFEMAGATIEVQAPIMVFREWHRHRTQCLGPDTLIHFDAPKSRHNRHSIYKMRIEDVWRKWQPTVRTVRPERQINPLWPRSRIQSMQLRMLEEGTEEIGYTKIVDVVRGDPKEMFTVTGVSGRSITLSMDHQMFTNVGWLSLKDALKQGVLLAVEGTSRAKSQRWERPLFNETDEYWKPVLYWEGIYEVSSEGRVRRVGCKPKNVTVGAQGYDVVSLNGSGQQKCGLRTVHSLVLEAFRGPQQDGMVARHLNNNRGDQRLVNLEWGTAQQNANDRIVSDRQQRLISAFEEVGEVQPVGMLPSYDIAVSGPFHNFIADGFVVHNSYNELSARYTPLPDLNYVPTIDRCLPQETTNKQAQGTGRVPTMAEVSMWLSELEAVYGHAQDIYELGLKLGIPKEIARLPVPVGRYSRMRASANLRNWLGFLTLRMDKAAQHEIRVYANLLHDALQKVFPRTIELFDRSTF